LLEQHFFITDCPITKLASKQFLLLIWERFDFKFQNKESINLNKDIPMQAVSSSRHKRQGSTKLAQIEEETAHANVEKMEGQIAVPRYS